MGNSTRSDLPSCNTRAVPNLNYFAFICKKSGCPGRARTSDKLINSQPLYQLSYWAKCWGWRIEPHTDNSPSSEFSSPYIPQRTYSWICSTFELYPNKILTMPSLTNTVAGTLTFPHTQNKETICIVLSFDCSTTWSTLATHLPSLCLSGLFPLSDPWHSSHRRHIGRLRLNSVSLNLIP